MISKNQLHELSAVEYDLNDKASLVDIKTLSIDTAQNKSDRMTQYTNSVRNPYLFRVGDTVVRIKYGEGKRTLQDSVTSFLISK